MTYCVGMMVDGGLIFASDSRTHAGVDNFASFCKLSLFKRACDRVIGLLSSGSLAGTQAIISLLRQRATKMVVPSLWDVESMYDAALLVSDAMREVGRRDGEHLTGQGAGFNASFILGGQIKGEPQRLFRLYSEGNFIEAGEAERDHTFAEADAASAEEISDARLTARQTSVKAEAKADDRTTAARGEAADLKRDASYEVAQERCEVFAGDAKAECLDEAEAYYAQHPGI